MSKSISEIILDQLQYKAGSGVRVGWGEEHKSLGSVITEKKA